MEVSKPSSSIIPQAHVPSAASVSDSAPVAILVTDASGRILFANHAAANLFNATGTILAGEFVNDPRWRPFRPNGEQYADDLHPAIAAAKAQSAVVEATMGFTDAAGSIRWVAACSEPFVARSHNGRMNVVTTFVDATAQANSGTALRDSESRLAAVVASAMDAIVSVDEEFNIIVFNPAAERLFGYQSTDVVGKPLGTLLPARFRAGHDRHVALFGQAGETNRRMGSLGILMARHSGGKEFPIEAAISVVKSGGGPIYTAIVRDITDRIRAENELKARLETEDFLSRVNQAIRASSEPDVIVQTVSELLGVALHAGRCYYVTIDEVHNAAAIAHDWRTPDLASIAGEYDADQTGFNFAELFSVGTIAYGDIRDMALPPATAARWEVAGLRAVLAVPFYENGQLTACLVLGNSVPREWTPDELETVEKVATLTRIALASAHLAQREHRIVQQLQSAVQPRLPKTAPGLEIECYYQPALREADVGGDFADLVRTVGDRTFMVVGDVSGKGLSAASQVSAVRNMLRFALKNGRSVSGPVGTLNATLSETDELDGFATLFVARFDPASKTLVYSNCGQEAGLVLRAATGAVERLPANGAAIGAFAEAAFTEQSVSLASGDFVVSCTDGITEAGPSRLELLGEDGLIRILGEMHDVVSASQLAQRIVARVDEFAGLGVPDDRCLLVARVL